MIQYKCPKCRETLESPDSLAGREDTCPNCGRQCTVPSVAGEEQPAAPGRKAKMKFIIGGAILAVLVAAGVVYYFMHDSAGRDNGSNLIKARRALVVSMSQGTQTFSADSDDHCALLLDIHEIIPVDDYRAIPKDKIYITFSGRRCDPSWDVVGVIVITTDKTEDMVKICFVVPKDVRTFTLHLGDRKPMKFTAPEEIEDEISEY